jgi:hypothetical protein
MTTVWFREPRERRASTGSTNHQRTGPPSRLLGEKLFDRVSRHLVPTAVGRTPSSRVPEMAASEPADARADDGGMEELRRRPHAAATGQGDLA